MSTQIAVIGAGPAGLMAAERLAQAGHAVTIYDRMPSVGRRFLMAGIGGLNLTHAEPLEGFIGRYREAASWITPYIERFGPAELRAWANALAADCFEGSSGRVFPKAMKASPLLRRWLARLDELGVAIATRHDWRGWDGDALIFDTPDGTITTKPHATILAMGGASWPRLGANGAWTGPLADAGIDVRALEPSNCGVLVEWSPYLVERFAGVPLKNIKLSIGEHRQRGEALITRRGLEGGAVYALTGPVREALGAGSATLIIDLKPDLSEADLSDRLANTRKGETLTNRLRKAARLEPAAIALLREAGAPPTIPGSLAAHIKALPIKLTGVAGLDRAISTAGGVERSALDQGLMLRARPGVFAAGEMLDWEAPTGGYLLTACFATGVAAAEGVQAWLQRDERFENR